MKVEILKWVKRGQVAKASYARWEARRVARLTGWSVGRRWATFVLLPAVVLCCGGTIVGVPVAWVFGETVEASRGASSPDAAADEYLMALSYGTEEGLLPILDDRHQNDLLAGWRSYRKSMKDTVPTPSRLDYGALTVGPVAGHEAEVSTEVSATWWGTDGRALAYSSEERVWRFRTHEDNGWHVQAVKAPAWCGGYVRADACS